MSEGCWSTDMNGYRDTEERRVCSGDPPRFQYEADDGWERPDRLDSWCDCFAAGDSAGLSVCGLWV